jgi:hypothetical protein
MAVLDSKLSGAGGSDSLRVTAFHDDADTDQLIHSLEQKQELEIVSSRRLTAGVGRPISFRAGAGRCCRLRVQFSPEIGSAGNLSLQVRPQITFRRGQGAESRQYETNLPAPGTFLVSGVLNNPGDLQALERLYPGHSWSGRQLVILVTSRVANLSPAAALARSNRGR